MCIRDSLEALLFKGFKPAQSSKGGGGDHDQPELLPHKMLGKSKKKIASNDQNESVIPQI